MSQISAKNICKRYGDFDALKNINMDITKGEFLTFLGPSGSGKTTLLMILAGFTDPTSGQLIKEGVDISALSAEERNFGMVFQGYALFPHMTIWQNVDYPLRIRKMGAALRKERVGRIIETVGLAEHAHKKPSQLSGGQQQRVALARSLVFEPDMLLLDEPLSALDRNLREQMQVELKRVHEETGTTFVFVTHDQGEALAMSDNIAIFNRGQVMQLASPDMIYNAPNSRFVAEFLGKINIFSVSDTGIDGGVLRGRSKGVELSAHAGDAKGPVSAIAVRPENMLLTSEQLMGEENSLRAQVTQSTYQGSHSDLTLETAWGQEIEVSTHSSQIGANPAIGADLWVSWKPDNSIIITD